MPRTRIATRKSYGAPRGQTSSSQPPAALAPVQENPEGKTKEREDRGKCPTPTNSKNEESLTQAGTESEVGTEVQTESSDEEMGNLRSNKLI